MWTHNILEIMKNNVILYCRSNIQNKKQASASTQHQHLQSQSSQLTEQQPQNLKELIKPDIEAQAEGARQQQASLVTWTLPDDKLVSSEMKDKYEILDTGDLLIKDLSWSDMGSYVCSVSDEQSSDSISTFVYPAAVKSNNKSKRATLNSKHLADFR